MANRSSTGQTSGPQPSLRRCGTCELLERSGTPGLATYGKCPHRAGWVRVQDEPCENHLGESGGPLVRILVGANLAAAALGAGTTTTIDILYGTLATHLILGFAAVVVAVFAWAVWKSGSFSEEAKYIVLETDDPPPEEDRDITFL